MNSKLILSLPGLALAALWCAPVTGFAGTTPPAPSSILLTAGNYGVLAGTGVTSTGVTGTTITSGDVGVAPGTSVTGFPPAVVVLPNSINGNLTANGQARLDLIKALAGLSGMAFNTTLSGTDLGGLTLVPGVYKFDDAASLDGTLTLDAGGKNDAHWVFQIGTALTTTINSKIVVINTGYNNGNDNGIFFVAGAEMTFGANNQLKGNYLSGTSITFGNNNTVNGRALAKAAVTLDLTMINSEAGPAGSDYTGGVMYDPSGNVLPTLPIFSLQPVNQSLPVGNSTTLSVAANHGATYQWQRQPFGNLTYSNLTNTGAYSNVTTANLTITNATAIMDGDQFRAVATNANGDTSSTSALLTVTTPLPVFSLQPVNSSVAAGSNTTLSVLANGNATYQWQIQPFGNITYSNLTNTGAYSNVTTANLTITNATVVMSGDQFRAVATNLGGATTSTSALLTVTAFPVFSVNPTDQVVPAATSATFTVVANGNATFQWQRQPFGNISYSNLTNDSTYSNVTGTTLTVSNTTVIMTGDQFRAVATNLGGATTSTSALLTVSTVLPIFSLQPVNQSVITGNSTSFTVAANGNATFLWQREAFGSLIYTNLTNAGAFTGVTTTTLHVGNTTFNMAGDQFRAVATNLGGSTSSTSALLDVTLSFPDFTSQPLDSTVAAGKAATFTVVAADATFQWQRKLAGASSFTNITEDDTYTGVVTATLTVSHTAVGMSGDQYRAVATNLSGSLASDGATLTVKSSAPVIVTQPQSAVIEEISNVKFHVVASGPGPFTYAWERNQVKLKNGARVYNANTATLILRRVLRAEAGNYRVVVTNSFGSTTSKSASLTVKRRTLSP